MLYILSGLLLSLNIFFLYKMIEMIEVTSETATGKNTGTKFSQNTAYYLLMMGMAEVFGAFISGGIADNQTDFFQRMFCFVGYFLVIISCIIAVNYKYYLMACAAVILNGFFSSTHNTIIQAMIAKRTGEKSEPFAIYRLFQALGFLLGALGSVDYINAMDFQFLYSLLLFGVFLLVWMFVADKYNEKKVKLIVKRERESLQSRFSYEEDEDEMNSSSSIVTLTRKKPVLDNFDEDDDD